MKALTNLKRNKTRQIKAQCPAKTRAIYKTAHADTNQPGWAPKDVFSLSRLLIRQWEKTSSIISARFTHTVRTHPTASATHSTEQNQTPRCSMHVFKWARQDTNTHRWWWTSITVTKQHSNTVCDVVLQILPDLFINTARSLLFSSPQLKVVVTLYAKNHPNKKTPTQHTGHLKSLFFSLQYLYWPCLQM